MRRLQLPAADSGERQVLVLLHVRVVFAVLLHRHVLILVQVAEHDGLAWAGRLAGGPDLAILNERADACRCADHTAAGSVDLSLSFNFSAANPLDAISALLHD